LKRPGLPSKGTPRSLALLLILTSSIDEHRSPLDPSCFFDLPSTSTEKGLNCSPWILQGHSFFYN
jgi:hypothetical protein